MVSINLELPENFLREEIRSGYKVEQKVKEVWAVELDLLNELKEVCEKNSITYYAMYGTLLGAVRHGGFIPWDDDIDVVVTRADYDKLCKIAENEFKHPYFFQTEHTDIGFTRSFARLRNSNTTALQENENARYVHYNQGIFIDIFPMDNVPDDEQEKIAFLKELGELQKRLWRFSALSFRSDWRGSKGWKKIVKKYISPIIRFVLEKLEIHNIYYDEYEKMLQKYNGQNTLKHGLLYFETQEGQSGRHLYDKSWFKDVEYLEFEGNKLPVPSGYMKFLEKAYGNWKEFVIGSNLHGDMVCDTSISYVEYINTINRY